MFTSEPSLIQRIERMISETPVIDSDTDLRPERLSAPDLFTLLSEPALLDTLLAAGMPRSVLDPARSEGERIRGVIPHLDRIRNTAAAWCFYRIVRDLFDFYDPNLTESNAPDLIDRIAQGGRDASWGTSILRDRCNLRTVITGLENRGSGAADESISFVYSFEAGRLFDRGGGLGGDEADYPLLRRLLAGKSTSKPRVLQQVHDWLDQNLIGPVQVCKVSFPGGRRMTPSGLAATDQALSRAAEPGPLSADDVDELAGLIHCQVYGWHADRGRMLQVAVGGETPVHGGRMAPPWPGELASTFHHFGNARFDLLARCDRSRREAAALASRLPNVSVSASWRQDFSAMSIADFVSLEVHEVPMTKLGGFASGASSAEWTYGKYQMVRKAMASGFARLIEAGYYEEDEIPPILLQILHDTPRSLLSPGK